MGISASHELIGNERRVRRISAAVLWLLLLPFQLSAQAIFVKEHGYTLDLPVGWEPFDASDPDKLSFSDPIHGAMLQVTVFSHEKDMSAGEMEKDLRGQINAQGEGAPFVFSGRESFLSDVTFSSAGKDLRGYLLVIKGLDGNSGAEPAEDCLLVCFATVDGYDQALDSILSALDSFSPDQEGRLLPGPISQFLSPFPDAERETISFQFLGQAVRVAIGAGDRDASQVLVEREARLLAAYKAGQVEAWNRFYRLIYRDCYHRLDGIVKVVSGALAAKKVPENEAPLRILAWIQGFEFKRTGTLADFLSPLSVAASASGDCDSRAILYDAILEHLGLDAILLVSVKYAHALAAVALDRDGAAFVLDGRKYIVAEMTEAVDIGMIPKDMADAKEWIAMRLRE
jgi:hypothetical protein